MKRKSYRSGFLALLLLPLLAPGSAGAQRPNFSYKFYGQVRGDLFYNSRANQENVDGLFYLFPKPHDYDAQGDDLNAKPNGSFYLLYTRLGLDITGPNVGRARTSAKIETDFRGSGSDWAILRIRHAYVNLDWGRSSVLVGQTWHPLFGDVHPSMLNLCTGAPFNPFNRSPQIRYRLLRDGFDFRAAAVWQLQYLSTGPNGKSEEYIKNGCVPELYAGVEYGRGGWKWGVGIDFLSIAPRTRSEVEGQTFKVAERVNALSGEAHFEYVDGKLHVAGKTLLANNLAHTSMLGGYGVTRVDPRTGERDYASYLFSTSWLNIYYDAKWRPGLFVGYLKNLGAGTALTGETYGVGLNVAQLFTTNLQLTYNLPHWRFGFEYSPSVAWYGAVDYADGGRVSADYHVTNHRVLGVMLYYF